MEIKVRDAVPGDIQDILDIEASSFEFPWSERMFMNQLRLRSIAAVLVAHSGNAVTGYSVVWFEGEDSHILNIAVSPEYRRRGVAGKLVDEIIRRSRERECVRLYLEVRASNLKARDFYVDKGFRIRGIIEGYYQENGEDALLLELSLI
jgi:ribosomal-protein-alanine N-acetyltransferase